MKTPEWRVAARPHSGSSKDTIKCNENPPDLQLPASETRRYWPHSGKPASASLSLPSSPQGPSHLPVVGAKERKERADTDMRRTIVTNSRTPVRIRAAIVESDDRKRHLQKTVEAKLFQRRRLGDDIYWHSSTGNRGATQPRGLAYKYSFPHQESDQKRKSRRSLKRSSSSSSSEYPPTRKHATEGKQSRKRRRTLVLSPPPKTSYFVPGFQSWV